MPRSANYFSVTILSTSIYFSGFIKNVRPSALVLNDDLQGACCIHNFTDCCVIILFTFLFSLNVA